MRNWLEQSEFAVFRTLFYSVLPIVDKYSFDELTIYRSDFLELFFVCCDAVDSTNQLNYAYRCRLKKAFLIVISKVSRDNAYLPLALKLLSGIRESKYIGVQDEN